MYKFSLQKIKTYIKYCYFFHKMLLTLSASKLYITIFNKPSPIINTILYQDIQNNGCVIIKLIQWLHTRHSKFCTTSNPDNSNNTNNTNNSNNSNNNFDNIYNNIYEKCTTHSTEYSNQLFKQEFSADFNDKIEIYPEYEIKSGSIAQVYKARFRNTGQDVAIKITHPELYEQTVFPYIYYRIYNMLTTKIPLFKNYRIPFELSEFFDSFTKQMNMRNEATNLKYFYKEYQSNPYIVIPKPIAWSNNILIMEYIEAIEFTQIENKISDYTKYKIIMLLSLFLKDTMCLHDYYHADLHGGNWKVVLAQNSNPSIVIYDFGFCIEKSNDDKISMQNIQKSLETNNIRKLAENIYKFIHYNPESISQTEFIEVVLNTTKNIEYNLYSNELLTFTTNYFITKKYIFKSQMLDMLITLLLVNNNFKKHLYKNDVDKEYLIDDRSTTIYNNERLQNLKSQIMNYINFCKTNKCFDKLVDYLIEYTNEIEENIDQSINRGFEQYTKRISPTNTPTTTNTTNTTINLEI